MKLWGWLLGLAACGSAKQDAQRDRDHRDLATRYSQLDAYATCLAGVRERPVDLFVALAFEDHVPLPSSCPPPAIDGVVLPDLVDTSHLENIQRVCAYLARAYDRLGETATKLGATPRPPPGCAPTSGVDWVKPVGDRTPARVHVRGDTAYMEGGSGRDAWWAYSTDGATWTTHAFESSPLSFRVRGDTVAALVHGGAEQQLYVGTGKALEARPKRTSPSSVALVGESSIVLVGGDDTWQTAAWSTDQGVTFGPDQKIAQPQYITARRVVLGDGDALIAASADDTQPVLVIDRAERGRPTEQVARMAFADDGYQPSIDVCQAGRTTWVVAGARQIAVSTDGGSSWTGLPPVSLAYDGGALHGVALTCTAERLGIRSGKEVVLCDAKACSPPLEVPKAAASYLRLAPKPELWSMGEGGGDRLVTVRRVERTLVPDRVYVMDFPEVPLVFEGGAWVELDDT